MSDRRNIFDIAGFDPVLLDIEQLKTLALTPTAIDTPAADWTATPYYRSEQGTIVRLDPHDKEQLPVLAVKISVSAADLHHEYAVLDALYDFGFHIGPRPLYVDDVVMITEWVHGEPLKHPPAPEDENKWHRMMAVMGVPNNLPFGQYASRIPMRGTAPHTPADLVDIIERELAKIDETSADYPQLAELVTRVKDQVAPQWNTLPPITLNHLDPRLHHFIWEGYHMRLISWQSADWADNAFAVGQLCAHPAYEDVPTSHWVWYRWELARLTKDELLIPRATTYTNLMLVYWTVRLTHLVTSTIVPETLQRLAAQRDRYLKRAKRGFV